MVIRRSEMRLVSIDLCLLCGPLWESMKSRRFCEARHGVRSTFRGFSLARLDRVVIAIDVGIIVSASTMNVTQIESNNAVSDGGSKGETCDRRASSEPKLVVLRPVVVGGEFFNSGLDGG